MTKASPALAGGAAMDGALALRQPVLAPLFVALVIVGAGALAWQRTPRLRAGDQALISQAPAAAHQLALP